MTLLLLWDSFETFLTLPPIKPAQWGISRKVPFCLLGGGWSGVGGTTQVKERNHSSLSAPQGTSVGIQSIPFVIQMRVCKPRAVGWPAREGMWSCLRKGISG